MQENKVSKRKIVDYSGVTEGTFTFLNKSHKKRDMVYYDVICSCGTKRKMTHFYAKRKAREYCRCKDQKTTEEICSDQIYQIYKNVNKFKKNNTLVFTIDKLFFISLLIKNCHYCNKPPLQIKKINKHEMKYNGIDRKDNNIGYTNENCVTCCWECNQGKKDRSLEEFNEWITKVYFNLNGDKQIEKESRRNE